MKKKIIGIFLSMLLILTVLPASGTEFMEKSYTLASLDGITLYVGGDGPGNYTNIQDAIDNATDGDTVFVYNGTYGVAHHRIEINKSINLIGENKVNTIINGSGIWVNVSEVLISGFTLQNSSGIYIDISNNITIDNNIVNGYSGIAMFYSSNSIVTNNSFFNCGLVLVGYHNLVSNNTVNDKPLVYLESTSDKVIDDAGQVILIECTNVTIKNLGLSNINIGILLYECTNCFIISNSLEYNYIAGIYLVNSTNNTVVGNIFLNNVFGLLFSFAYNNNISGNHFQNEFLNVGLVYSNNNLFSKNNFIFNFSFRRFKSIISAESDNKWKGNYWNRARVLPIFIWGTKRIPFFKYRTRPCLDVDWRPAQEPYDILYKINS